MWLLIAIIRPITNNPKIFMCLAGAIYGFLTYKCILPVYEIWGKKRNFYFYLLIFVLISNISLVQLTGLRFFTAALLYCYCILTYLRKKRLIYLIFSIATLLIHFGFIPIIIATFAYFLGAKRLFYKPALAGCILTASFIISFLPLRSLSNQYLSSSNLIENQAISGKFSSYTNEEAEAVDQNVSLYRQANDLFTEVFYVINRIGAYILMMVLIFKTNTDRLPDLFRKLFYFSIFLFVVAFIAVSAIGSGQRLLKIAWYFFLIYFAFYLYIKPTRQNKFFAKSLIFYNFYSISFLFFNAPRLADSFIWYMNLPVLIIDGFDFEMPLLL